MMTRVVLLYTLIVTAPAAVATSQDTSLQECNQAHADEICASLFNQLDRLSKKGSSTASTMLAVFYATGEQGIAQDHQQAIRLFTKAAHRGEAVAQLELAKYLLLGEHIDADPAQALTLLKSASDRGYDEATMLYNALLIDHPETTAQQRNRLIEELSSLKVVLPDSVYAFLGHYYLTRQRPDDARFYLQAAAERGHQQAHQLLTEHFAVAPLSASDADNSTMERIEITADAVDINDLARELIRMIKAEPMFTGKATGTRIPGQGCVLDGTCFVLSKQRDIQLLNNILSGVRR